jgi:Asp/Glu/hydantoin racemase
MRKLLVINPNTSAVVTGLLERHVSAALGSQAEVHCVTARLGAPYIACEASYAVAAHAALDAWAAALAGPASPPDAVLIGCFGDPGLLALRESSAAPVSGLAEAAFFEAAQRGRFAVVTGGPRWQPMLQRLADSLGYHASLAGVLTVAPSGVELAADPALARALLLAACQDAVERLGVQSVIVGGAALAGMAEAMQADCKVPLIDSVLAGARQSLALRPQIPPAPERSGFDFPWSGVAGELAALGGVAKAA